MNTNEGMPIPSPYPAKMNQPLPTGYYQQGQPLPTGTPMTMAAGSYSMACNCPYCHQSIATRAEKDSGVAVWLSATLICVLGCFCGCCLIPFCLDDLKDTIHYCPNCNRVIAKNKKL